MEELDEMRRRLREDETYRNPKGKQEFKPGFSGHSVSKPNFSGKPFNKSNAFSGKPITADAKRGKSWNVLLRVGALSGSLLGMYISAQFSVDGFKFSVDERAWIGWGLAVILVLLESVWQKFGGNLTLFALAMTCYAYGIVTNVLGIMQNRGGYDGNPTSLIVPVMFGLLLEVFPEPVMAWAISGDISSDPLRKLVEHLSNGE